MASWNTWDWGSGTQADPYKVMSLKELKQLLTDTISSTESNLTIYIEFATSDRQGNPIPVSERIDDCRYNNWLLEDVGFKVNFNYGGGYSLKVFVNGNGWTILGLSLRRSHLISVNTNTSGGSPSYSKEDTLYLENLIFKNVYVQGSGMYALLYVNGGAARAEISNCKFSGVIDNSGNQSYNTGQGNNVNIIGGSGGGVNVFTACSFNFKFIGHFKLSQKSGQSGAPNATEFNNCLFNFSGKYTGTTSENPGYPDYAYTYGAIMYFCKCQGQIIMDTRVGNMYLHMFFDYGGTLNVVDVDIRILDDVANYLKVFYRHSNATSKDIFYVQPDKSYSYFNVVNKGNAASFILPSNRAQLVDASWLEDQGFIVGSAPTT